MNKKNFSNLCNLGLQLKEKDESFVDLTWSVDGLLEPVLNIYMYSMKGFVYETNINIETSDINSIVDGCCVPYSEFVAAVDKTKVKDGMILELLSDELIVRSGTYSKSIKVVPQHSVRIQKPDKVSDKYTCKGVLSVVKTLKDVRLSREDDTLSEITNRVHFIYDKDNITFWSTTGAGVCSIEVETTRTNELPDTVQLAEATSFSLPPAYVKNLSLLIKEGKNENIKFHLYMKRLRQKDVYHLVLDDGITNLHIPVELDDAYATVMNTIIHHNDMKNMEYTEVEFIGKDNSKLLDSIKEYRKEIRKISDKSDKFDVGVRFCCNCTKAIDGGKNPCSAIILYDTYGNIADKNIGLVKGICLDFSATAFDIEWFLSTASNISVLKEDKMVEMKGDNADNKCSLFIPTA